MADPIIGKISVGDGATFTPAVSSAGELSWTNNKNLPNPETVDIAQAVVDKKPGWGIPIGYEYFTINPNIPQGSLPLFGGEYSRETYPDLWAWVQEQTGYLKTEAQWQTLATNNNGNVPYYSDGDGNTTFRVPSLKCWVKAANGTVSEVGSYLQAGLPNITGSYENTTWNYNGSQSRSGAFNRTTGSVDYGSATGNKPSTVLTFDASLSNSIYGNSTTVQPESIVGLWLVQAYGVVVDTGTINEQQYIDDRFAAAKDYTDSEVETGVPTGCVQAFAGQNTPTGWLLCDGSAISRVQYNKLFSVIGTSYGAGDGSTTFNVPNLIDKFIQGNATAGTVKSAGLPNITGAFSSRRSVFGGSYSQVVFPENRGAFHTYNDSQTGVSVIGGGSGGSSMTVSEFNASWNNSIYGNSTTVQPPALTMRYIIKY